MMSRKIKVLLDTNVVLDVLAKREPHFPAARTIWAYVEKGEIEGVLAAHSITTIAYLLAKTLPQLKVKNALTKLLQVFSIAPVERTVILNALALDWRDFEDAVQMSAAEAVSTDYLVTRNTKDFISSATISVLPPDELLVILAAINN